MLAQGSALGQCVQGVLLLSELVAHPKIWQTPFAMSNVKRTLQTPLEVLCMGYGSSAVLCNFAFVTGTDSWRVAMLPLYLADGRHILLCTACFDSR